MRCVVFGAGAIGCTLAAHLYRTGHTVTLVGRPEQVTKIRRDRLRFTTGDETWMLDLPVTDSPADLTPFTEADAVLLSVKSQHTLQVLGQLKSVGAPRDLAIVCCQNGIWNEPTCARSFHRVHGMNNVIQAVYLQPGVVLNPMTVRYGFVEIGAFPSGADALAEKMAADLTDAGFSAAVHPDVMLPKATKCLGNLTNVVRALTGSDEQGEELIKRLRDEAMAVWRACGIEWEDYGRFRRRLEADPGSGSSRKDTRTRGSLGQHGKACSAGRGRSRPAC